PQPLPPPGKTVRIAVARDAAFCFVYEDNLRLLREAGAELVMFSPLLDERLPEDICGMYLPGGYPELFADALETGHAMKTGSGSRSKRGCRSMPNAAASST
ncbi:MAG TPA: hypothetical protein VEM32_04980, partial [Geobacteraceae bacterium]|nr:hypothetical protein [Geobacteraceae bacterium]